MIQIMEIFLKLIHDILIIRKKKTKEFPFCPEIKTVPNEKYNDYMEKIKPRNDNKS